MRYGFINNFSQTLAADLAAGATTMTLDGGGSSLSNASADLVYTLTLDDGEGNLEIAHVTGASGNDLTIERGKEGTTDAAWPSGTKVEMRVTARQMGSFLFYDEGSGNIASYKPNDPNSNPLGSSASGSSVAIGDGVFVNASSAVAMGDAAEATGQYSSALGPWSNASASEAVALGGSSASGENSIAGGLSASASGVSSVALGNNSGASEASATACGHGASASAQGASALGAGAAASIPGGVAIGGIHYLPSMAANNPSPASAASRSSAQVVVATQALDLTSNAAAVTLELPAGTVLLIDAIDVVITGSDSPGGSPEISVGPDDVTPAAYLAATPVTKTAVGERETHSPIVVDGVTSLRVATSSAGSGTTYTAKIVLRGYVMEL